MVKPQRLQRFDDGKNRSMATTDRPAHSPLYWSWRTSSPQPASAIALDSDGGQFRKDGVLRCFPTTGEAYNLFHIN